MRWLSFLTVVLMLAAWSAPLAAAPEVPDDEIHDQVRLKLAGDRDVRGTNIRVEVKDGVVTLRGRVINDKAKKRATKLTRKVKGVKKVINELTVPPK